MRLSIRNQLKGTVKSVTLGPVMAEVVVDVDGKDMTAEMTRGSAENDPWVMEGEGELSHWSGTSGRAGIGAVPSERRSGGA
jgi:hypothetical protein